MGFLAHEIKLSVKTRSAKQSNYEEVFKKYWKVREVLRLEQSMDKNDAYCTNKLFYKFQSKTETFQKNTTNYIIVLHFRKMQWFSSS